MSEVRRSDWVKPMVGEDIGFVRRVAKDGSWADVDWGSWSKRMTTDKLRVQHTIPFMDGSITDCNREAELRAHEPSA